MFSSNVILFDNILVQYVRLRNRSLRRHFLRVVDYSRKGWHGNINSTLKEPNKRPLNNGVTMFSPSFSLTLPMNSSSGLLLLCLRLKTTHTTDLRYYLIQWKLYYNLNARVNLPPSTLMFPCYYKHYGLKLKLKSSVRELC